MKNTVFKQKIYPFLLTAYRWYLLTPERSLEAAYQAAIKIQGMEEKHFHGNKIDNESSTYSSSVMDYFETDLQKLLKTVKMRLTEFKASQWLANESKQKAAMKVGIEYTSPALILEKLEFIDQVTSKYNNNDIQTYENLNSQPVKVPADLIKSQSFTPKTSSQINQNIKKGKANTTGILPRSIFNTITRLQVELDPSSEQDVVRNFRQAQKRSIISIRFILLLIIVPLLTHQISKALIVGPLVEHFRNEEKVAVFLNEEMEEEGLLKLQRFEERIKFEALITNAPPLGSEELEKKIKEKAEELKEEFRQESDNAIKNVFADIFAVISFTVLLLISKSSVAVLKEFIDNVVYGLSDSAKAFIIILFTDVFVGFHSPHGWEVLLEGISRHWGLPANRDF
ncbi:MAG: proton extrusion protein PcxA, partial [Dolichospermum sp.]